MVKSRKIHANQLPETFTGKRYNFQKDHFGEPVIELDLSSLEDSIDEIDPDILFELQKERSHLSKNHTLKMRQFLEVD